MSIRSDEILKLLEANTVMPVPVDPMPISSVVQDEKLQKDVVEDYEFSRKTIRGLVETSAEAIESLKNLALDCEEPRSFEVLGQMLRDTAEITEKLMDLQKNRQEVDGTTSKKDRSGSGHIGTQNVFVGSTSSLQKMLVEKMKTAEKVDPEDDAGP